MPECMRDHRIFARAAHSLARRSVPTMYAEATLLFDEVRLGRLSHADPSRWH